MKLPAGRRAILLLGLPLGLAAAGALAYTQLAAAAPKEVPDPGAGQHGPLLALEERVINLQPGGAYRYAKIGVTVELRPASAAFYALTGEARSTSEKEALTEHQADVPLLLDALGSVVSAEDSNKLTAPSGRDDLKKQLLAAARSLLGERDVLDIYFTDLVMQ
ncbi:MAG TPA: flagellar basal body-associated FliL family protein [Candidatus Limnocylindrales bacterium]